jgi:predicted O-methyltransferase YrrM
VIRRRRRGGSPPPEEAPLEPGWFRRIELDYPIRPRPRWGYGAPSHPGIKAVLDRSRDRYRENLQAIVGLREPLAAIPTTGTDDPAQPAWVNGFLPGLDAAALYTFLTRSDPALYLEVGSGNSTKFARRAIKDQGLRTRLVSIDPEPRAEVDALCDEVVRAPAEDVDLSVFDELGEGDVLFIDNSHRSLQNSDATVMFLEVLPRLAPGVLVEIHDITLPDDYPREWLDRFYSEQYLLAAWLLADGDRFDVELPNHYVSTDDELASVVLPLWDGPTFEGVERHGGSFWLRTR